MNFLGLLIEGPSAVGHYVRPLFRSSDEKMVGLDEGPIIRPDGRTHEWTLVYDPEAAEGGGQVSMMLDAQRLTMELTAASRKGNAAFDRFGFLSYQRGGHFVEIYFDDLVYTARPAQASRPAGG